MDEFANGDLHFDVTDRGPGDAPAIVLLHGFPADRSCWDGVGARLVEAGYRTLAPDQRGYSPRARPSGRRSYRLELLGEDILAMVDAAGLRRFHLVGHDWGAAVGWWLAGSVPDQVASFTAVSVPHSRAMVSAFGHSTQALHSWYMLAFQLPGLPERLLGRDGGAYLRRSLRSSGLDPDAAARYARRAVEPDGLTGPLGWYRAIPWGVRDEAHPVTVPTTMVWGPGDGFVSRAAAEGARRWVDAPYRFVEVTDGDHWLPEGRPDAVAAAVLAQVRAQPLGEPPHA